jgi:hypothetical protein
VSRRPAWRAARVIVALLALASPAVAATGDLERAVKATYLYKFAPFVTWPSSALGAEEPLVICVQGADPFGGLLDHAVAGQRIGGHPLVVRRVARLVRGSGCHIAYVSGSSVQAANDALAAVQGTPVLTVTDGERAPTRGVVHLMLQGGRVRFSVSASQAAVNGIAISSKLLALAVEVSR